MAEAKKIVQQEYPLKTRPNRKERPALEALQPMDERPEGEKSKETEFRVNQVIERLEANGDSKPWIIDHVSESGVILMRERLTKEQEKANEKARKARKPFKDARMIMNLNPEELRAEIKIGELAREIAGKNGAVYDGLMNVLTDQEDLPKGGEKRYVVEEQPENDALHAYLMANKGQILEYMAVCIQVEGITKQEAYKKAAHQAETVLALQEKNAGNAKKTEALKDFFEVDYKIVARAMNDVANDFRARRGSDMLSDEALTEEKTRLALMVGNITSPDAESKKAAYRANVGTDGAVKRTFSGEMDQPHQLEATFAELEEQLDIDLQDAIKHLESKEATARSIELGGIEWVRDMQIRLMSDYNEIRIAKGQQALSEVDYQDLPVPWFYFWNLVQQHKQLWGKKDQAYVPHVRDTNFYGDEDPQGLQGLPELPPRGTNAQETGTMIIEKTEAIPVPPKMKLSPKLHSETIMMESLPTAPATAPENLPVEPEPKDIFAGLSKEERMAEKTMANETVEAVRAKTMLSTPEAKPEAKVEKKKEKKPAEAKKEEPKKVAIDTSEESSAGGFSAPVEKWMAQGGAKKPAPKGLIARITSWFSSTEQELLG